MKAADLPSFSMPVNAPSSLIFFLCDLVQLLILSCYAREITAYDHSSSTRIVLYKPKRIRYDFWIVIIYKQSVASCNS